MMWKAEIASSKHAQKEPEVQLYRTQSVMRLISGRKTNQNQISWKIPQNAVFVIAKNLQMLDRKLLVFV